MAVNPFSRDQHVTVTEDVFTGQSIRAVLAGQALVYGTPWALTLAAGLATEEAHLAWGGNPTLTPFVTLAFAGVGGGLTTWANKLTAGDKTRRILYTANMGALTAGSTIGLVTGMSHNTLAAWTAGGIMLNLATNLRRLVGKVGGRERTSKWAKIEDAIGLAKYELTSVESNGRGMITARVEAKEGATGDDFTKKLPAMASAAHLGKGRITATVDREDSSVITLRAAVADLLAMDLPWPGPLYPGRSITEPSVIGHYDDGEDVVVNVTGLRRDAAGKWSGVLPHLLVMGTTGSGKSEFARVTLADTMTRTDVTVWAVDCSKGMQTFGAIRHGIDWFITDAKTARQFFRIMEDVIRARTNHLASMGLTQWIPGCGLSFLVVWLEEAADFAAGSSAYDRMLRTARSAGVKIISSLQRATYTNISPDSRSNHGDSMCFGTSTAGQTNDAAFALPDEVIEAGADPAWGSTRPGCAYLAGLGTDRARWSQVLKTWLSSSAELAEVVTATAPYRCTLDEVTATAAGKAYAARTVYTTPVLPGEAAAPAAPAPSAVTPVRSAVAVAERPDDVDDVDADEIPDDAAGDAPELEDLDMDEDEVRREVEELTDMFEQITAMDPEPGEYPGVDLNTEIPDRAPGEPELSLAGDDQAGRLTTDQARDALYARLDEWASQGRPAFRPAELADIWGRVNRGDGRRWFYRVRDDLMSAGVIAESEEFGEYILVRSPLDNPPQADAA
jgi:hypothetical protein